MPIESGAYEFQDQFQKLLLNLHDTLSLSSSWRCMSRSSLKGLRFCITSNGWLKIFVRLQRSALVSKIPEFFFIFPVFFLIFPACFLLPFSVRLLVIFSVRFLVTFFRMTSCYLSRPRNICCSCFINTKVLLCPFGCISPSWSFRARNHRVQFVLHNITIYMHSTYTIHRAHVHNIVSCK